MHSQWICKRISVSVKKFYVVLITRKTIAHIRNLEQALNHGLKLQKRLIKNS